MRKIALGLLLLFIGTFSHGQVKIFAKFSCNDNATGSPRGCSLVSEGDYGVKHAEEIPITTFSDQDENPITLSSGTAPAGKAQLTSVVFSKLASGNSAGFAGRMYPGTVINRIQFTMYDALDKPQQTITFGRAYITSIQKAVASCTGACPGVIENYTITAQQKLVTSYDYKPDGTLNGTLVSGWDFLANRSINSIN